MEHGSCTVHVQATAVHTAEQRSCMYGLRYETGSEIACVCVSVCDSVFVRRAFLYIRNGVVLTLARTRRRHGTAHGACFAHRGLRSFALRVSGYATDTSPQEASTVGLGAQMAYNSSTQLCK